MLQRLNGSAADWVIRAAITAFIGWGLVDIRGIHLQQAEDTAEITRLRTELESHIDASDDKSLRQDITNIMVTLARLEEKFNAFEKTIGKK